MEFDPLAAGDIPQRLDFFSRMCRQLNVPWLGHQGCDDISTVSIPNLSENPFNVNKTQLDDTV